MTVNAIDDFLRENTSRIKQISDRVNTEIGFNAFALVSDVYYRENFHSDIIAAILNPHSDHGEGTLFLKKFLTFVSDVARDEGERDEGKEYFLKLAEKLQALVPTVDDSVEVAREEGRIDVKITAHNWTIIVENKINGAYDMDRQIPRYIEQCRAQDEKVEAVVYITAATPGFPSENGWEPGDDKMVKHLLIPVIGFSETRSIKNLAEDWIGPCALAARGFNAKSILEQYAGLLRHQSGETMNQDEVKKVMKSMCEHGVLYSEMLTLVQRMPETLVDIVVKEFKIHPALKRTWPWFHRRSNESVAVLVLKSVNLENGEICDLTLDVHCESPNNMGMRFFDRNCNAPCENILPVLKEVEPYFYLISEEGKGVVNVLNIDGDWVYGHVDEFLAKIRRILDHLEKNRKSIEAICRGETV